MGPIASWLPALDGVVPQLQRGARVADVGCGHGASTVLMARTYPHAQFIGYDYHGESIRMARERAAEAGVTHARFEIADAVSYPEKGFDLIAFFNCQVVVDQGGFTRFRRAAQTPFNLVLEARPSSASRVARAQSRFRSKTVSLRFG